MSSRNAPAKGQEPAAFNFGQGALQAIFSVFLGLMITAFVGVGVYTFYPNPAEPRQEQISALYERQNEINQCDKVTGCRSNSELTQSERDELERIDKQVRALEQENSKQMSAWAQRTSVILVALATILMAISLALGQSVSVISNGVLLGGLFTMLYAVGWGIASGNSISRFLVLSAALAISVGLGYLRFVRGRAAGTGRPVAGTAGAGGAQPTPGGPEERAVALESRVSDLERRLAAAAAGLGSGPAMAPRPPDQVPPPAPSAAVPPS